jgi:hypothetical protein
MRSFIYLLGMLALASTASALETAAGADTVNSSQIGINAKLDASTAVLKQGISQITNCGAANSIFKPGTGCVPVVTLETDPVASAQLANIFTCGNANKIAHSDGSCSDPNYVANILTCNKNQQFYDPDSNSCKSASGATWGRVTKSGGLLGSNNIKAVTRASKGVYNITFVKAMPTANYAVTVTLAGNYYVGTSTPSVSNQTKGGFRVTTQGWNVGSYDQDFGFTVFGN